MSRILHLAIELVMNFQYIQHIYYIHYDYDFVVVKHLHCHLCVMHHVFEVLGFQHFILRFNKMSLQELKGKNNLTLKP